MTICACPFCFTQVERRGDYCASCLDVHCCEAFAPRKTWTYDWPRLAEVLFRVWRVWGHAWLAALGFLRWFFAYDRCDVCGTWHPRSESECLEFDGEQSRSGEPRLLRVVFCKMCCAGRSHEELEAYFWAACREAERSDS
jgi:hypothetical protein